MDYDDVIYGRIHLPVDVVAIVETSQFQRLKHIRQMGFLKLDNVREYQANRFSHCIGTYHAACRMLDALEKNTPWLSDDNNNKIPQVYRRAVEIAALVHDVGHGPFSHTWESVAFDYQHENVGFAVVDAIFDTIDQKLFPELRDNYDYGIRLIKALIKGKIKNLDKFELELPQKYEFIFGIVSNKTSKIDVDKWDYLQRDHYYIKQYCDIILDVDDVFLNAKVSLCGQHIEYRYEDYDKIYNLFAARWYFHKNCYQLPRHWICDEILKWAVVETKPKINDREISLITAENDMPAFLQLTDSNVLRLIEQHPLRQLLNYDTNFEEVEDVRAANDMDLDMPLSATIFVRGVASFMLKDNFHFYGDEKSIPSIVDKTETIQKPILFNWNLSKNTVYYSLKAVKDQNLT